LNKFNIETSLTKVYIAQIFSYIKNPLLTTLFALQVATSVCIQQHVLSVACIHLLQCH
jgi:hypothetical protein